MIYLVNGAFLPEMIVADEELHLSLDLLVLINKARIWSVLDELWHMCMSGDVLHARLLYVLHDNMCSESQVVTMALLNIAC